MILPRDPDRTRPFNTNGTEGMLDVILSCTLIFILLTCLIQAGKSETREKALPPVNLTRSAKVKAGSQHVRKTTVTIKNENNLPRLFYNEKNVSFAQLSEALHNGRGITHIALRRDKNVPCEWEDKIIIICRKAGVRQISIIVAEAAKQRQK